MRWNFCSLGAGLLLAVAASGCFGVIPAIEKSQRKKEATTVTKTQQNFLANEFLDDSFEATGFHNRKFKDFSAKLVHTGRKDAQDHEVLHLELYADNTLYYVLKPVFEPYPLSYQMFHVYPGATIQDKLTNKKAMKTTEMVLLASDRKSFLEIGEGIGIWTSKRNKEMDGQFASYYRETLCTMCSKQDLERVEKNKARLDREIIEQLDTAMTWVEAKLASAKGKTYQELIDKFSDRESFLFSRDDSHGFHDIKITTRRGANNSIEEFTFQFRYIDDQYHDKEKFYAKATKGPDGFFRVNNPNENLPIQNGTILVPFESYLILFSAANTLYTQEGIIAVAQLISPELTDPMLKGMLVTNHFLPDPADFAREKRQEELYPTWWMKKHLETEYLPTKDILLFRTFITMYWREISKNK
jgi:hypothetical protein